MCSVCRSEPATHPLQAHIHQRSHYTASLVLRPTYKFVGGLAMIKLALVNI